MNEWITPPTVRAMLADLRPADAVALWAGIETAEAHPARMLVGAWLAACAASERSVDLRVRHADAMIAARRMAGIARRDLYRRLLDAGFGRASCGHSSHDSWHDRIGEQDVIRCGVCEEAPGEVWP